MKKITMMQSIPTRLGTSPAVLAVSERGQQLRKESAEPWKFKIIFIKVGEEITITAHHAKLLAFRCKANSRDDFQQVIFSYDSVPSNMTTVSLLRNTVLALMHAIAEPVGKASRLEHEELSLL